MTLCQFYKLQNISKICMFHYFYNSFQGSKATAMLILNSCVIPPVFISVVNNTGRIKSWEEEHVVWSFNYQIVLCKLSYMELMQMKTREYGCFRHNVVFCRKVRIVLLNKIIRRIDSICSFILIYMYLLEDWTRLYVYNSVYKCS